MATSSSSPPLATSQLPVIKGEEKPSNWAELHPDLLSSILLRLSPLEILENARKVCRSWRRVSKDPLIWRRIDMRNLRRLYCIYAMEACCRHVVDLSQGGLLEFNIDQWRFQTTSLLNYMAERSSNLRRLRVKGGQITSVGIFEAIVKLPLLEELELLYCSIEEEHFKTIGQACPNLKTLKLVGFWSHLNESDNDALAIADTMPGLLHLQLISNGLTNIGLNAILDGCPHLECLDLRQCFNINLFGDVERQFLERIKDFRCPNDVLDDYNYVIFSDNGSIEDEKGEEEENYSYGSDDTEYGYRRSADF
ncbi:unnamed protein product [Arabidopsis thaliana]|uniref:F-box domain-containing protein n=1 Tax=Arabidopsis thaliana TaxID=3702 RepID=A0A654FLL8_ARATH|nr:unnamed protein product [Arabidopsis thaliana]